MARETITITTSDWSGERIEDPKDAWTLMLRSGDGRRRLWVADLTNSEAEELKKRGGREQAARGRRPKTS